MLFKAILNEGYTGGYTIVCDFIRNWRNQGSKGTAYVPLKFAFGEAFQFDWSEEWLVIGGIHRKVLAAHQTMRQPCIHAVRLSITKPRDVV